MGIRTVAAAAASLALVVSMAACSSGKGSAGGKVSLSYGVWDATQVPAMQKIITAFEAQNPDISVTVQQTPWADYWTKLQAAATGGAAPDVFWMNGPNFQLYASNNVIKPLTDLHQDTSVYPASLVKLYQYQGVQYGLPKDFDTVGLWYNKALFDAAGVAYPTGAWTWADFQAAAKKLTDPARGVYGVGATLEGQENFYDTIFQAGGYVVSPDGKKSGYADPNTIAGLKFWTDLIAAKASPSLKQMTDTAPLNMFESGKLAMFWGGSWDAKAFATNDGTKTGIGVAPLPTGAKKATVIHGLANVVSAHTAHTAQAEKFVQFLGSQQAAQIEADTGTVIPAYNGTQQEWVKAYPQYQLNVFLDQLPDAVPLPVSRDTAAWNTLEANLLTKAWDGSEPVGTVAAELATQMNAALAKEGS
ncbi:ABC transporter substrate-binding protein [Catenulispora pinisilvae]|uniref:ABC transporter substrate-binding protein n=1 Tax=Catenulispora pinisilvae TaxID=2705253 RepID=UPI001891EE77|nr:sugar ABC transporter substrate-binding protein [Catenulispora pinisilvae]